MSKTSRGVICLTWIGAFVALVFPRVAAGHRLDEYLQATRISIARDSVALGIDLTPGVEVGPMIAALMNQDRDGRISAAEGQAYANQLVRDVVLELDGRRQQLSLTRSQFPSIEEMCSGTGTIRIEARASLSAGAPGQHSLMYTNNHRPDGSVYLVNALVPSSRAIEINGQHRDNLQRGIRVTFNVTSASAASAFLPWLLIVGMAFLAWIVYEYTRMRRRHRHMAANNLASEPGDRIRLSVTLPNNLTL
jgi:hypothetical protein